MIFFSNYQFCYFGGLYPGVWTAFQTCCDLSIRWGWNSKPNQGTTSFMKNKGLWVFQWARFCNKQLSSELVREKAEESETVSSEKGEEAQSRSAVEPRTPSRDNFNKRSILRHRDQEARESHVVCIVLGDGRRSPLNLSLFQQDWSHRKSKLQPDHTNRNGKNPEPVHLSKIIALQIVF